MPIPDTTEANVEVTFSNIAEIWVAELADIHGKPLAVATAPTRAESLRALADAIEAEN